MAPERGGAENEPAESPSAGETASPRSPAPPFDVEHFLGDPTKDLAEWAKLWSGDHPFPIRGRAGLAGRLAMALKRLLRPLLRFAEAEHRDRQRVFNLILIEAVERERGNRVRIHDLRRYVEQLHADFQGAIEAHAERLVELDRRLAGGMQDVMRHNDALFARLDQKLDRYRREAKGLADRLGAFIAASESAPPAPLAEVQRQQSYLALELRHRGSEAEIGERVAAYLPYLEGRGPVLDLGCGRGEALELFTRHGIAARGVDASGEMVAICRSKGLDVVEGGIFEHLVEVPEGSLGAVVSFHVVEHLPAESLERLARLAWRALVPGGALVLETPSPLSLVMAGRNFWVDPTHQRPVHPATLELALREAGFEPVHRLDLHPFPEDERLPEVDLGELPETQRALADHVNRLRDRLDDLLYGFQDYGLVGLKPSRGASDEASSQKGT